MHDELYSSVAAVLSAARQSARTPAAVGDLDEVTRRFHGPLRLAVAGKVKAGKSTLLNALLSEELAPTDAGECTQLVTWYRMADHPQVLMYPTSGPAQSRPFRRGGGALDIDLGHPVAEVDHLEVGWPNTRLRDLTLVDTPGIASISTDVSARTQRVLAPEQDRPPAVDAVLYLLRHTHASDIRFLESFHDDELAHGTPVNAVGVLSRADEIGSCRLDAIDVARRVATRYQSDGRLRRLCPVVIPVAGLLAFAGESLREAEYRALAQFAALSPVERGELLLSADRFARRETRAAVTELERGHLLQRLGLFGVRLSIELIVAGAAPDAGMLSVGLVERSGLEQLRGVLSRQFTHRSQLLKSRSALAALQSILSAGGCSGTDSLRSRIEEIIAGAHEFQEVRLLDQLRNDDLGMSAARITELERLLGGAGHDERSRLGLTETASPDEIRAAALESLARWQRIAEHPISSRAVQLTARGAVRTLEGMLAGAGQPLR